MAEFLGLTAYKVSDTVDTLQRELDTIAGIGTEAGFQLSQIIKALGQPDEVKFGNGQMPNQQSAPASSKAEQKVIDDAQDKALADYKIKIADDQKKQDDNLKNHLDNDKVHEDAQDLEIKGKEPLAVNDGTATKDQIKVKRTDGTTI